MRRLGGVITQAATAAMLVGTVALALGIYNGEHRSTEEMTAFHAASTRAASSGLPFEGRSDYWGRVAIHPVIDDGTLNPIPEGIAADVWSAFLRIVTPGFAAEHMSAMLIADAPDNRSAAAIERASIKPMHWSLTVNLAADLTRERYLRTLVHEYAHLLTLGEGEVDPAASHCTTLRVQEGCLDTDSLLKRFDERFWEPYGGKAPDPDSRSSAEGWNLYRGHTADFTTVYAATNIVEDVAETFTEFVIRDRPSRESGTWANKILMFWEEPEYVAIRTHIRSWFAQELPEARIPTTDTHRG